MELAISFGISFGLAFFCALVIYALDRYEKESKRLLVAVFLWGAIIAVIGAIIAEAVLEFGTYSITRSEFFADWVTVSIFAPIVEESLKGLAVLLVLLVIRSEFDSILDGLVYAGIVALGFAAVENWLYAYGLGFLKSGTEGMYAILFMRGVLGAWHHPMFTAFIGIGLAMARLTNNTSTKILAPIGGWMVAVLAHATHNTLAQAFGGLGVITAYLVDWTGWAVIFGVLVWAVRREKSWLVRHLREEMEAGIISAEQYLVACSSTAQMGLSIRSLFSARERTSKQFYRACAELAFKKEQRQYDSPDTEARIETLRARVASLSAQLA